MLLNIVSVNPRTEQMIRKYLTPYITFSQENSIHLKRFIFQII